MSPRSFSQENHITQRVCKGVFKVFLRLHTYIYSEIYSALRFLTAPLAPPTWYMSLSWPWNCVFYSHSLLTLKWDNTRQLIGHMCWVWLGHSLAPPLNRKWVHSCGFDCPLSDVQGVTSRPTDCRFGDMPRVVGARTLCPPEPGGLNVRSRLQNVSLLTSRLISPLLPLFSRSETHSYQDYRCSHGVCLWFLGALTFFKQARVYLKVSHEH